MSRAIEQGLEQIAQQMPALTFEDLPELKDILSCPDGTFEEWCLITPIQLLSVQKPEMSRFETEAKAEILHLEQVFQNPKARLIRREERVAIERVSRFRPRALTQLANHSEDWEARTIAGVRPKRLLAELSDQEFDRLEHRVAVVLVKRLDEYLSRRCRELKNLLGELNELQETDQGQSWHWRRQRAYSLFINFQDSEYTSKVKEDLSILENLHRQVKQLQSTKLFQIIPKQLKSGYQPTNLFTFDPHYRGMARLWLAQINTNLVKTSEEKATAEEKFSQAFNDYCFLLVQRAFEQMKFRITGKPYRKESILTGWIRNWTFSHQVDGKMELISPEGQILLTIIPFSNSLWQISLEKLHYIFETQKPASSPLDSQIVVMHLALEEDITGEPKAHLRQDEIKPTLPFGMVSVSPQHIFSVERIARAITWTILSATYIDCKNVDKNVLRQCPVCSKVGEIEIRGEDFQGECLSCKTKWGMRRDGLGRRYPVLIPSNQGLVKNWKSLEQLFGRDVLTPPTDGELPIQKFKVTT